jgi:transposase
MKRFKVTLSKEEREELHDIVKKGKRKAQTIRNALILLNCDEGKHGNKVRNEDVAKILHIGDRTIDRLKKLFVEEGFEIAIHGKTEVSPKYHKRIIDGETEAKLVSLCCSAPPEGFAQWSLRLLADQMIELKYVDSISYETVRRTLKKTNLSLGKSKGG